MKLITTKKFLKRIIFILILFIIFMIKANASTLTTQYYAQLIYDDRMIALIESKSSRLDTLHNYMQQINCFTYNNTSYCLNSGNYALILKSMENDSAWQVVICDFNYTNGTYPYITTKYEASSTSYQNFAMSCSGISGTINWNNNNISSITFNGFGTYSIGEPTIGGNKFSGNPNNENITITIPYYTSVYEYNKYYDTYFLNSNRVIRYNQNTESNDYKNVKLYDGTNTYSPPTNIPSKAFLDSFLPNRSPDIDYALTKQNGYYDLDIILTNWNTENAFKYDIYLYDENNAINEYIPPANQGESGNFTITKKVYEAKTYTLSIFNKETLETDKELLINIPSIQYDNFLVEITNIDKDRNRITYTYFNMGNNYNFHCTHQIEGGNEVNDSNCNSLDKSFTISVGGNKNVTFRVYNSDNELIYQSTQNFVFQVNQPYINFNENYENGIVNINVVLNRYNETNYTVKYSINNGTLLSVSPVQLDEIVTDMYGFTIGNVVQNSTIQVNIYNSSNRIIASSTYKVNYSYISNNIGKTIDTNNIKGLFNNLSLDNISSELKTMIKNIGEQIFSTRLGQIIYVTITIIAIGFVISLIRR